MAVMIPDEFDGTSKGEKRIFCELQELPDDVIAYHNPRIKQREPDFVVIAPSIGVIVIEVKGIALNWITSADERDIQYRQAGQERTEKHPGRQARDYMNRLRDLCRAHPQADQLMQGGRFAFAFGHVAILTAIHRGELDAKPWGGVFPPDETVCSDELEAALGRPEALMQMLRRAIYKEIPITPLSPARVRLVRSIISPAGRVDPGPYPPGVSTPDTVEMLDFEQEKAARTIGTGHRILYGVPGSGKTVILVAMARLLAQDEKSVLVLCYNNSLYAYLERTLKELRPFVRVQKFGAWARDQGAPVNSDEETFGQGLLNIMQTGGGQAGKYDAVLIDEGQDFRASWFRSAVMALSEPADGTLVIAYDLAQNLYGADKPVWSRLGIKAPGRIRKFEKNYRNTREIVGAAWSFGLPEAPTDDDTPYPVALKPENCLRSGPWPVFQSFANRREQILGHVELAKNLIAGNAVGGVRLESVRAEEIMILCKLNATKDELAAELSRNGMPVNVSTIHGSRGLQAKAVIVVEAENLRDPDDRALMYVAATRPTDLLCVLWSRETSITKELSRNLQDAQISP